MLKTLVHQEEGTEIVGEKSLAVGSLEQLHNAVAEISPDVLVLGCEHPLQLGLEEGLLSRYPQLRVIALERQGRTALIYRKRTEKLQIDEVSPGVLLHAVKGFIYPIG